MANRMCLSASPPLSSGRPTSGVLADDCTLDTVSSQGARVSKHSRVCASRTEKFRRKESSRTLRGHRLSASQQLANYADANSLASGKPIGTSFSLTKEPAHAHHASNTRPGFRRFHSDPNAVPRSADEKIGGDERMEDSLQKRGLEPMNGHSTLKDTSNTQTEYHEMFRQPETNPITEEQLINEKCIEIDRQQTESKAELSGPQWQALISLHRTLLYEHHDFFLASQHPSASLVLKRLADKYAMPARMWRYGIHSFLELLRQKLPDSLDYMLNFINLAYSMMTLLLESVSAFRDTWIECLGDLARYRMAVEEADMRDREVWAGVSRYWYNQDADRNPDVGRIQHHLAVLARPDVLQQLFYYTKALVSVRPFPNARESVLLLFNSYHGQPLQQLTMVTAFIATHGVLFTRGPTERFVTLANLFLALLRRDIRRLSRQGQQGVYMMSCNFASMLQYGEPEAVMAMEFSKQRETETVDEAHTFALEWTRGTDNADPSSQTMSVTVDRISTQMALQGSCLAFHTLTVLLDQIGDSNIHPSVHTSLAFIWCLALHPPAMQQLEQMIPWLAIAKFLNTLFRPDTIVAKIENASFPLFDDGIIQQLPEDFLIRGQAWSQLYYPEKFFENAPSEDERPIIEDPSAAIPRRHRCLWLGTKIATVSQRDPD
ncbi:DNA/RNA-binding domain E.t1.c1-type [Penicillium maclennaniae]|uniref:DNA/RNA-binding domain E.t1.c1-type n=1 Tax=Penicillium maclennaniae TaxID=1343394 RepID=UPI002540DE2A|nr:DNA/RNA-binding domain E.t1.c1-type [Penicillium maclennaniae]KAJ5665566.1 DNA/RNA-binding domain E.t1.c1-type [Penicillium maclennaniae]